jgi:O-antigen ligase
LVGLACVVLAFGPLAFGAVQPWAILTLELGGTVCLCVWTLRQLTDGAFKVHWNPLFVPALLFAAVIGMQLVLGRSSDWFATWQDALLWAAYGMLFFVATQCFLSSELLRAFALFFTCYGFLVAVFAIVQQFTWNGSLYWVVHLRDGGWGYGPYVDHAHYAGLMEMLTPIPLVFALTEHWQKAQRTLFGFVALVMAGTIFLSKSAGGILAFMIEMAFFGIVLAARQRSRVQMLLLFSFGVLLAIWLTTFSPRGIGEGIVKLGDAGKNDRVLMTKDSLKLIAQRPLLGWGLGTFSAVYPSVRSFHTNYFVNAAHNDYIQTAVETGVVGLLLVLGFAVLLYRNGLRETAAWRTSVGNSVRMAALIGATGILMHSFWDFNLQIPANAALFFVLAAIATADSSGQRPSKTTPLS